MENSSLKNKIAFNSPNKKIFFIGIGGIGMSALARYFNTQHYEVSGYDKTPTALTNLLQDEDIDIHFEDNVNFAPKDIAFVVYTPAIPATHSQLNFYINNGYTVLKRSDVLQWITETSFNICVAGTHGKTTTSCMIGHVLRHSNFGCNAFLGGISANYRTNFWSQSNGSDSKENIVVVEADEYDRSFLKLVPNIAIITSVDADHLDIYGTAEEVVNAFVDFSSKVKPSGYLLCKYGLSCDERFVVENKTTYSVNNEKADIYINNLTIVNGAYNFDVITKDWVLKSITLLMGGLHNIENCLAAIGVAKYLKIDDDKIRNAIKAFKGVKRRFEYILDENRIQNKLINTAESPVLIDDYAHHPEELKALINGIRSLYGQQKCTLVFQPHLFSRTKDLEKEFSEVLSTVDELILLPIYPAREQPIEGVTSELLLKNATYSNATVMNRDEVLSYVQNKKPRLLIMAGAGDIDSLVYEVKPIMEDMEY